VRVRDIATLRRTQVNVLAEDGCQEIGIRSFGRGIFHKEPTIGAALGNKRVFEIHPGDLVLSNVFAWEGAIALASDAEAGMIGSHRFMTYEVDASRADANYLRYYFLSPRGLAQIRRASPGSAGRNRTLGIESFEALQIPLPDLSEQRAAAHRLDVVYARASDVRRQTVTAERLAAALPGSLAKRTDLPTSEREARGWRHLPLANIMTLAQKACPVATDGSYPNIGIYSFGRGLFEKPPIDGMSTSATTLYRIHAGQFIYSRLFAFEGAYGAVPDRFDGYYVSNEFPTFDVDASLADARFLAAYFRARDVWESVARSSRGLGSRRQRVHPEAVLAFGVWLPPLAEQQAVVDQVERLSISATYRDASLRALKALEASALHTLIPQP
jgi:type I restriction enzyme, S subunit